ncbi:MAG: hypothetical protein WBA97_35970 [Actinophytocola sp.]|uniref:hypothetical protein n=1 Tax=Actinophytocola sp. TaxID=1872138 RepID=UPI003C71491E
MADLPRRRMRSASVAIGVTAAVAAALSGCSATEDYNTVCVDEDTYERVDDYECDDDDNYGSGGGYIWYYLGSSRRVPSVGSRVSGGSTTAPSGSSGRSGSSSSDSGGSSSKSGSSSTDYGGFGGSSGGVSS